MITISHVLLSVLCYDLWFYAAHRALHTPALWRYHALHHTKQRPTAWDTYTASRVENILQGLGAWIPALWLTFTWQEVALLVLFFNARGLARHDPRTAWLVDRGHHLIHHLTPGCNYGEPWLDWLWGTSSKATPPTT
jgi:lathosterol oxidase